MTGITRIVRLTFSDDLVSEFIEIYRVSFPLISSFPGCIQLKLMQDVDYPNIFYTVSKWESKDALENYRKSQLFKTTWAKTKLLFSDRPQAFSFMDFVDQDLYE